MDEGFLVNTRLRIEKNRVIHIHRTLPRIEGEVFVSPGQEVAPADVLGEGQTAAGFRTIPLAHDLKVNPGDAFSCLRRDIGQTIYRGELLAEKEGFLGLGKILYPSPVDGVIEYYDEKRGDLRIKLLNKKVKLLSGVHGVVDLVDRSLRIITVRTLVSLVYGIFGSGRERDGILQMLGSAEQLVSTRQIKEDMRGHIVVGGALVFADALEKAINTGVSGIISGGINASDHRSISGGTWNITKKHWSDIGLALMITEGFGSIPMGEDIFNLLKEYDGKFAVIDGNRSRLILPSFDDDCMIYIRKHRLPAAGQVEINPQMLLTPMKVGLKVRIISGQLLGKQGTVTALDQTPTKLESGISTIMVTVETKSAKVKIPYPNLEILG